MNTITTLPNAYDRRALNGVITRAINETKKAGLTCHEALVHAALACRPENGNDLTGGSGFGDKSYLERLLNEMPRAGRTEAMADWLNFYFPLNAKFSKEQGRWTIGVYREGQSKKFRPWNWLGDANAEDPRARMGALNVAYYDLTDERPQKPLSVAQLIGMIKEATAKVADAKEKGRPVVGDTEANMKALAAAAAALGMEDEDIARLKELDKKAAANLNEARRERVEEDLGEALRDAA